MRQELWHITDGDGEFKEGELSAIELKHQHISLEWILFSFPQPQACCPCSVGYE